MSNFKTNTMEDIIYDLDYFINKFNDIPTYDWTTNTYQNIYGSKCAFGHCGSTNQKHSEESAKLIDLMISLGVDSIDILMANDGYLDFIKYGHTPKERVVNYLKSLKDANRKNS